MPSLHLAAHLRPHSNVHGAPVSPETTVRPCFTCEHNNKNATTQASGRSSGMLTTGQCLVMGGEAGTHVSELTAKSLITNKSKYIGAEQLVLSQHEMVSLKF